MIQLEAENQNQVKNKNPAVAPSLAENSVGEAVESNHPSDEVTQSGVTYTEMTPDTESSVSAFNTALNAASGDAFSAARKVYQSLFAGRFVNTVIGKVLLTGGGWQEMKNGMKSDALRAKTIPFIPEILASGEYLGAEELHKPRNDGTVSFHPFKKRVSVDDIQVEAMVKVAGREDHQLAYHLKADHVMDSAQTQNPPTGGLGRGALFRCSGVPSEPTTMPESTSTPLLTVDTRLDHIFDAVNADDDWNIEILHVWDKDGNELDPETLEPLQHAGASVDTEPAPIEITGNELGDFADDAQGMIERRKATRAYLEETLKGKWIDVSSINSKVEIRQSGIDESIAWSAKPEKLKALAKLDTIIAGAHSPDYQPNHKQGKKPAALRYIHMKNTVSVDGKATEFTVIVEEDINGLLHYDIMIDPKKAKATLDSSNAAYAGVILSQIPNLGFSHDLTLDRADSSVNGMVLNLFIEGEELPDNEDKGGRLGENKSAKDTIIQAFRELVAPPTNELIAQAKAALADDAELFNDAGDALHHAAQVTQSAYPIETVS